MKYAFVFPGQGSQFVGMGKELAENFTSARDVFNEVNEALSQDLFKIMTEGPDAELTMTANTQPALMAFSLAIVRVLEKDFGVDFTKKAAEESFCSGCFARTQTLHYRYHSGDWYLHDYAAQHR